MRILGLLGGMSWESTKEYYRIINEGVRAELGGLNSAPLLLHSFNFAEIAELQHDNKWQELGDRVSNAALGLEKAGAEAIIICTNLMHKLAPQIEAAITIPVLHIADAVAEEMKQRGHNKAGLLGTEYTMTEPFYSDRLASHGMAVCIPNEQDRSIVHKAIYDELCQGVITSATRSNFLNICKSLQDNGAEGIILGCTEIPLLISEEHTDIPLYDTTVIHAKAALEWALSDIEKQKVA